MRISRESKSQSRMRTEMGKMRENIPEGVVGRWVCLWAIWGSFPCTGTYYTRHQAPPAQRYFELCKSWSWRFRAAILVADRTSSTKPGGFALLAGDASVDSWFREIHVPRAWRVYLATGFDFREKSRVCFGSIGARLWLQPPTLPLYYEGKVKNTIFPQNFVYVLRTTTTRHMVSFIDFYFHFLAKFQT